MANKFSECIKDCLAAVCFFCLFIPYNIWTNFIQRLEERKGHWPKYNLFLRLMLLAFAAANLQIMHQYYQRAIHPGNTVRSDPATAKQFYKTWSNAHIAAMVFAIIIAALLLMKIFILLHQCTKQKINHPKTHWLVAGIMGAFYVLLIVGLGYYSKGAYYGFKNLQSSSQGHPKLPFNDEKQVWLMFVGLIITLTVMSAIFFLRICRAAYYIFSHDQHDNPRVKRGEARTLKTLTLAPEILIVAGLGCLMQAMALYYYENLSLANGHISSKMGELGKAAVWLLAIGISLLALKFLFCSVDRIPENTYNNDWDAAYNALEPIA